MARIKRALLPAQDPSAGEVVDGSHLGLLEKQDEGGPSS